MTKRWDYITPGIPDHLFLRDEVPMTKEEVRVLTLSRLRLKPHHHLVDIGAGTGSISVEAALLLKEGRVTAVEKKAKGVELIGRNSRAFGLSNLHTIYGTAPEALGTLTSADRIVIGGSSGRLPEILERCSALLVEDGVLVLNCLLLETLDSSLKMLQELGFTSVDLLALSCARGEPGPGGQGTMLKPLNPVFIISAGKEVESFA